ncbi:response regulator transcription factor [Paenibacillus sp. SYP-B3998]|uniref:Response regulator transcription factor n=1 Tax=Paenibacillus sp. SYP-B3998 TaxID=2678564 RepID=A0A6G4A2I1_9BACL|nr:response regulator transcription factor [Paenibacillus sp. SYP-B3998]NEW08144.1 response regulator transcription factor [Paenibacillus sp. SYP-B3998]
MFRVFIVDDEPFILEGLYDIIDWAEVGLEIVGQASDGQKALEALQETSVDILMTDISMPVMNGLDLIREARKVHPDLKVIVLSGFDEFSYLKEGMMLGIENYLLKPINIKELKATLHNTIKKLNTFKETSLAQAFNKQVLKDNTLHRWLTHQIAPLEFYERVDLLGIDLDRAFMAASVLRSESDTAEIFEHISAQVEPYDWITSFCDMDGDVIVLAAMDEVEHGKMELIRLFQELQVGMQDQPLRISIGNVEHLPEQAGQSYASAKKVQEYFWIYPELQLIDASELAFSQGNQKVDFSMIEWAIYAKLIVARDQENLRQQIQGDFKRIQGLAGITPQDFRDIAFEMVIRFKMELKAIRHTEENDVYNEAFQQIRRAETIENLEAAIQKMADTTIGFLISDVRSPIVQQVLKYIHQSYAEELSLKMLGAHYHIHPVYLGQLFHKEINESFTEYINRYRIEKAKELLKTTHSKVHVIAREVGYWEAGYFYKQFKKYVGISPLDYRGLL